MRSRFINNFIQGARSVLVLFYADDYIVPDRKGFYRDAKNLSNDFRTVGKDMRKALTKRHG